MLERVKQLVRVHHRRLLVLADADTITASSDEATELLFPNTASLNILRGETHKKYRFRVSADERLHILLTPFAGNPDLFARFGRPPLDGPPPPPPPGAPPAAGGPVFKSTEPSGIEVLQVSPTAENGCEATGAADGCFLHLAVQAATDCSYSIMVRMGEARIELKPGQTQAGVAAAHDSQEYWMWLEQPERGYSVELTSFRGSPTIYSRLKRRRSDKTSPAPPPRQSRHALRHALRRTRRASPYS